MSGDPTPDESPGGDWLAAEAALGVADAAARREAKERLARDPAFAAELAAWQARLAPLSAGAAPVTPPADLWPRIAAAIGAAPGRARAGAAGPGLWQNLAFWRWATAGSLGLAAACLVALVIGLRPSPPPLVAALGPAGGAPILNALVEPGGRGLVLLPAALDGAGARVPELWLVPPGGEPRSLGVIQAGRAIRLALPPGLVPHMRPDAALAVSLEPPGGSPTGRPTGPVVAQGVLAAL